MSDEATPATASDTTTAAPATAPAEAEAASEAPAVEGQDADAKEGQGEGEKAPSNPSKLLAAVTRKKEKLRAERQAHEKTVADFRAQQAQVQQKIEEGEHLKRLLADLKNDPDAVAEALGLSYDAWTAKRLKRGTPDEKFAAIEAKLDAEKKAREAKEQELAQMRAQAEAKQAAEQLVTMVKDPTRYPETSIYEPNEILDAAAAVELVLHKQTGQWPSIGEIAAEMEKRLAGANARHRARFGVTPPTAGEKPKAGAKTLTSRTGAESSGKTREVTPEELEARTRKELADWFTAMSKS